MAITTELGIAYSGVYYRGLPLTQANLADAVYHWRQEAERLRLLARKAGELAQAIQDTYPPGCCCDPERDCDCEFLREASALEVLARERARDAEKVLRAQAWTLEDKAARGERLLQVCKLSGGAR